jgi:uncharacterized protein with NRDE domain
MIVVAMCVRRRMCLLVFSFGAKNLPFLLCSNRDETFRRETLRGAYDDDREAYCPIDREAGGTWIAISGKANGRFAIILNFHLFRYDTLLDWKEPSSPKSRGLLPHFYLSASDDVTPTIFARSLLQQNQYQGYNLILGDQNSCCYVSNGDSTLLQLQPKTLYGISNGRLTDEWAKVFISKQRISTLLDSSITSLDEARLLSEQLVDCMKDSTPLPDATYGTMIPDFMKLSAVCVPPLKWNHYPYGTRTITIAICLPVEITSRQNLLVVENDRPNPDLPSEWERNECVMTFTPPLIPR